MAVKKLEELPYLQINVEQRYLMKWPTYSGSGSRCVFIDRYVCKLCPRYMRKHSVEQLKKKHTLIAERNFVFYLPNQKKNKFYAVKETPNYEYFFYVKQFHFTLFLCCLLPSISFEGSYFQQIEYKTKINTTGRQNQPTEYCQLF